MTPTDARILAAIIEHRRAHGVSPSLRQLCRLCGLSSVASTHVQALALAGHLTLVDGARGMVPTCERRSYEGRG